MPERFDAQFVAVCEWAKANRLAVARLLERHFGPCRALLDHSHNSFEPLPDGAVIIRKGAVRVLPGGLAVIPLPTWARSEVEEILDISHILLYHGIELAF